MSKLFLLRHLKSQWNLDKEFAGWVDNPLSNEGILAAKDMHQKLANEKIDVIYTSPLIRNMETVLRIYEHNPNWYPLFIHLDGGRTQKWGNFTDINDDDLPTYVSQTLNERYYGKLQGLNKDEIIRKFGQEKVHLWRRGWDERPPGGESLKDVYRRAVPFFKKYVEKDLAVGKNVLVVASHNSLRALVKHIENISDKDIGDRELEFGELLEYEFKDSLFFKL